LGLAWLPQPRQTQAGKNNKPTRIMALATIQDSRALGSAIIIVLSLTIMQGSNALNLVITPGPSSFNLAIMSNSSVLR